MSRGNFVTQPFGNAVLVIAFGLVLQAMFKLNVNGATIAVNHNEADDETANVTTSFLPALITGPKSTVNTGASMPREDLSTSVEGQSTSVEGQSTSVECQSTSVEGLGANSAEPTIDSDSVSGETSSDAENSQNITTAPSLTPIGDATTKPPPGIDGNGINPDSEVTTSFGGLLLSSMFPLYGLFPINATFEPVQNESSETTFPPSLINLACAIIDEYGGWNFMFKYPMSEVEEALCRCNDYCEDFTIEPDIANELKLFFVDPLSSENLGEFVPVVSAYSLIFVVGVSGNILILIGLSTWMKQKTPTYGFIMSLSCSDMILLCVCLPLKVTEYFHLGNVFTVVTCKLTYYLRDFIMTVSVLTLTVISFERYYAICKPFMVQYLCTWTRARKLIVITWTLSLVLALPTVFIVKFYQIESHVYAECLPQSKTDLYLILYFTYCTGVLFALPSIIMMCTYGRSCHVLWRSTIVAKRLKGMESKSDNDQNKDQSQKDTDDITARKKVVRGLVCIVALFTICWGPSLITQLLTVSFIVPSRNKYRLGFETLTYISSAINPYLFMTMSSQFCEPLRCLCYYRRKPETPQETKTRATEFTSSAGGIETQTKY